MASTTHSYYYQPAASQPINMPQKPGHYANPHYSAYGQMPMSPPEAPQSVSTHSGVASYDPSATSSSYAGSASEYEASSTGASTVDMFDYMGERLSTAFNPLPLDRALVQQAQTSGQLNAKTRELQELQALAQSRLAAMQATFAEGMKAAKEVQQDLDWTQKRVAAMNERAARNYAAEYAMAQQRYPAPVDY
ncbi:hypothetical protein EJ06DRAFT_332119 [Trichodelitschia bisporula]|uniref:Biogenesis of lysosome-related organelles complex 1 subunit KXD1 n=1 Tax=Trichodelitschia bisporula TaxID=703511 RepID=A0A6G1I1Y5_9PEZI|nr:hypothetical protein EJ06DRAFT_332119 [Trichodelitschia bisporula]